MTLVMQTVALSESQVKSTRDLAHALEDANEAITRAISAAPVFRAIAGGQAVNRNQHVKAVAALTDLRSIVSVIQNAWVPPVPEEPEFDDHQRKVIAEVIVLSRRYLIPIARDSAAPFMLIPCERVGSVHHDVENAAYAEFAARHVATIDFAIGVECGFASIRPNKPPAYPAAHARGFRVGQVLSARRAEGFQP